MKNPKNITHVVVDGHSLTLEEFVAVARYNATVEIAPSAIEAMNKSRALAEKIANLPLVIAAKAEEGRIFGAITAADLAEALAAKGIEIDRKTIAVENIKTLGEYEAVAKIHRDVKATIKFTVTAEE